MNTIKQWYAVYTKPRWEKKVADLLSKKEIENYCPLNKVRKQWADRKKTVLEPLFTSYVFVRVHEKEHLQLKQTEGVLNLVYWLKKPAIIKEAEINAIRNFLDEHRDIKLEKTPVNINDSIKVISGPLMEREGKVLEIRNRSVKIVLPSLGFAMVAEVKTSNIRVITQYSSAREIYI
jgi:transcription antitermination factor NusG